MTRIIALMPVRNEAWIVERTLRTLTTFCDRIIVADQRSTDATPEILAKFAPKVEVIDNPSHTHSTEVRWRLLEAARKYGKRNFLLFTDADEILSANLLDERAPDFFLSLEPGTSILVELVNLWRSASVWRQDDSIWSDRWMEIGFRDDGKLRYGPLTCTMDHNLRIPPCGKVERLEPVKLLHFQFVLFERMLAKQRWYRTMEGVELGQAQAQAINHYYRSTRDERRVHLTPIKPEWTAGWTARGIDLEHFAGQPLYWHEVEVLRYFADKGPSYFAALDIWDVDWEEKRRLAKSHGYGGIPEEPLVDLRTTEQRLYHAYLHRFFRTPPWRDPWELLQAPKRWLRAGIRALGLRRRHLERFGLLNFKTALINYKNINNIDK